MSWKLATVHQRLKVYWSNGWEQGVQVIYGNNKLASENVSRQNDSLHTVFRGGSTSLMRMNGEKTYLILLHMDCQQLAYTLATNEV